MKYSIQIQECRLVVRDTISLPFEFIENDTQAAAVFAPLAEGLPHEEMWVACLDAKNKVRGLMRVGQGGTNSCALLHSDILRPAIVAGASAILLAHNHPSGDPTPSADDVDTTRQIHRAADLLGVTLLDHLVIAGGASSSIRTLLGGEW